MGVYVASEGGKGEREEARDIAETCQARDSWMVEGWRRVGQGRRWSMEEGEGRMVVIWVKIMAVVWMVWGFGQGEGM